MTYALGPGQIEQKAFEENRKHGSPIPQAVLKKPSLFLGLELAYSGFLNLESCRLQPDAPIPLTAMIDYCKAFEIDGDSAEDFLWLVSRLDAHYITQLRKRNE